MGWTSCKKSYLEKDIQNIQVIFCHWITKHAHSHFLANTNGTTCDKDKHDLPLVDLG
jgi:hypothetical protein